MASTTTNYSNLLTISAGGFTDFIVMVGKANFNGTPAVCWIGLNSSTDTAKMDALLFDASFLSAYASTYTPKIARYYTAKTMYKIQIIVAGSSLFVVTIVIPVLFGVLLHRNRKNLWRPSMKARIGSLYLGINTERFLPLTYAIVFLVRRSLFVLVMFTMPNQPAIQMNLFIYMSNLYIIYLF